MTTTTLSRTINAPVERVFDVVAHIEEGKKAVHSIVNVEFMSETRRGVGTKFRETRMLSGREASTDLEVVEYVKNDTVRLIAETHGTVWDARFTVRDAQGQTEVRMVMVAHAEKLFLRLLLPLMRGVIKRAINKDLDAIADFCRRCEAEPARQTQCLSHPDGARYPVTRASSRTTRPTASVSR